MKVLVLASCIFAIASAGWAPIQSGYHGPLHHPVIHKGVPVEPAEVQHARAAHLAALEKAAAHAGPYHEEQHYDNNELQQDDGQYKHDNGLYTQQDNGHYAQQDDGQYHENQDYGYHVQHHALPVVRQHQQDYHHSAPIQHHHIAPAYQTSHVIPAIGHDGKPLDTPEVEAAKAHHFAAYHEALSHATPQGHHYRQRRSIYAHHIPIIDKHGVPVEPLEVQHARAEHLAAHAAAGHHEYAHDEHSYEEHSHQEHHHVPEGHAHLEENHHGYTLHQKHAPVYGHHDAHTYFIPKYDYHGRPLDTEEVEHAKALHFAAHAKLAHHYF